MNTRKKIFTVAGWAVLVLALVLIYLPILLVIAYSFVDSKFVGASGDVGFALYERLFSNDKLMEAAANTIIIGLVSALIATVLGTVSAVGIHYLKRGKQAVNIVSQLTVYNAEIVTAVGLFLLVIFLKNINIPVSRGMGWLILCHTVMTVPYVILTVSPRLGQLNPNLFEAGMDLGAGSLRTMFTVIFPQLIKGMISGFALAFTLSLDDFVVTNLNRGSVNTISTYVFNSIRRGIDPAVRALSTIIFVVVLAVLVAVNIAGKKKNKSKYK
ncbi:ABC transporter permease [Pumilibacter intestinalis]|uniref:ABC transporter permease n=1 Tax=Pumilibacter intestinalis TaxID=2941511 RepID=UPI00203BF670|nr:ABC transporter permease [Pumilibacter intestinalis]MCI8487901.1 ABC transporter permease [Clostridia bacterium]